MGEVKTPCSVKLIMGMISRDETLFKQAEEVLSRRFGLVDFRSKIMRFDHTCYYEKEMGTNLLRRFLSFRRLIRPDDLPKIKLHTNQLEKKFISSTTPSRPINLDPGYLSASKLILATVKDYRHRIYLDKGIYGEATLYFQSGSFHPWGWTYPDYKTKEYIEIFNEIRRIYLKEKV